MLKLSFLVWCVWFEGSLIVYDRVIRRVFERYSSSIEETNLKLTNLAKQVSEELRSISPEIAKGLFTLLAKCLASSAFTSYDPKLKES